MYQSRIAAWLWGAFIALGALPVHALPESGWWWNPAESGRGFFLEVEGPSLFMAGYFYENDGRATWLVSNSVMPANDSYQGRLLRVTGGQSLLGDYLSPQSVVDAGPISLSFTDDRTGTLTWAGGSVPIQRYIFNPDVATFQPVTGWWWNPDESGRGFSMELQGDQMFIGAYMYDAAGNPIWYVASAVMQSPTLFRGDLLQVANGQTLTGAYRAPDAPVVVGSISVQFTSDASAIVTLSDGTQVSGAAASKGKPKSFNVQTQVNVLPPIPLPVSFTGSFRQVMTDSKLPYKIEVTGTLTLVEPELTLPGRDSRDYEISVGRATTKISGALPDPSHGCPDGIITGGGSQDLFPPQGGLHMGRSGKYSGRIQFNVSFDMSMCGGTLPVSWFVFIPVVGTLRWESPQPMTGSLTEHVEDATITSSWNLTPAR